MQCFVIYDLQHQSGFLRFIRRASFFPDVAEIEAVTDVFLPLK